ncbi:hypothetical protein ZOSMA_44G01400 [Zostera marina]|uniref:protein-tyrosine-phosphatase n=1 Tax=Zostera marina TaxID=29655 RepID=A0A0K9P3D9_ZOSMR|nr:hypothetical protein ZOSMA_44G01400 [Zostera marina]
MIEVLDAPMENLEQHFDDCIDFIEQAKDSGGSVLVHCFAGISRSATIVVSYLMKKHQISALQAIDLVRRKRPKVSPNSGFFMQLKNFEKSIQVPIGRLTIDC